MSLDPRTPVLVGVGQITNRPDASTSPADRPEPAALMAMALERAAEDCDGVEAGAAAPAGRALLTRAESLRVVGPFGWRTANPSMEVARRIGRGADQLPAELILSAVGGNMPQTMLHDAAKAIARGDLDVVLVTGAEALHTRAAARRDLDQPSLVWTSQSVDTPPPTIFGVDRAPGTDVEVARGITLPINAYPLIENALRGANGWSLDEHRARIGRLWSRFSQVAEDNPYAWIRQSKTAEEIIEPGPDNRLVSFPYTKFAMANLEVDQGAAYVLCSAEAAQAAGVPKDRWVFPLSGADAHDHWFMSHRPDLHRSPAIALAGQAALALAGVGIDDIGPIDLYSCFPAVVQMAALELGLPIDDPDRPLTLTGGLTFGGGPGNNYVSHGIAQMATALRKEPGTVGLVTGLGWYATKHAVGIYGTNPPAHGRAEFSWRDVQAEVDALPQRRVVTGAVSPVTVETYTATFNRDGSFDRAIVACLSADENRVWANVVDPDEAIALTHEEGIGRKGAVDEAGVLTLS